MLERPGLRKEKKEKKTVWKRFTQEDKPNPDKNKGNQSKTGSKSGTTTSKPNQEEASKSGQTKQTKAKNKGGSGADVSKTLDDILEDAKQEELQREKLLNMLNLVHTNRLPMILMH